MRFSVLQEHLARGLAVVSHAVASRATLPILSNVYLSTEDGGLRLTATNLEIAITHWIPAKVEEKGATTIPARILGDVVSGLPNEKIDLELLADGRINLKCGKHRSHLRATPADDYPPVGAAGERPTARIAQKTLRAALESTVFAAAMTFSTVALFCASVSLPSVWKTIVAESPARAGKIGRAHV